MEFAGTFKITDDSLDRHSERVMPDGVDVSHFKNHPVMFYNHHRSVDAYWADGNATKITPIGKWENITSKDGAIYADAVIDTQDPLGKEVFRKVQNGIINACSIGFRAVEWSDDEELKLQGQRGYTITKSELLEVSIVDIPSNRNAIKVNSEFNKNINNKDSDKGDLVFINNGYKQENKNNKNKTKMSLGEKAKNILASIFGSPVSTVEELNNLAEQKEVQDIASNFLKNNGFDMDAVNEKIAASMEDFYAAKSTESEDKIKALSEKYDNALEEKENAIKALEGKIEDLAKKKIDGLKEDGKKDMEFVKTTSTATPEAKDINEEVKAAWKKSQEGK